jgi:uncharacterized membrane protein YdbT with pleckstrin-like domain
MSLDLQTGEVELIDKRMSWRGAVWDYRTLVGLILGIVPAFLVIPLLRYRTRYTVTDRRAYARYGLIARDETPIRIEDIRETELSQSMVKRLLGIGYIRLPTAGTDAKELEFRKVADPEAVRNTIEDAREEISSRRR